VGYLTTLFQQIDYTYSDDGSIMNWKGLGRKRPWPIEILFRNVPGRTEEDHENLSQESWCSGRDSNRAFPKFKSKASPLDQPVRCHVHQIYLGQCAVPNIIPLLKETFVSVRLITFTVQFRFTKAKKCLALTRTMNVSYVVCHDKAIGLLFHCIFSIL
jgi:hypothetical protein